MSGVMDTQDMVGGIRGLCLIAVVRRSATGLSRESAEAITLEHISGPVARFEDALGRFAGIEKDTIREMRTLGMDIDGLDQFYNYDSVNMQLSLLSGQPIPPYPFISDAGIDAVALARPFLDIEKPSSCRGARADAGTISSRWGGNVLARSDDLPRADLGA
jgi:hypothetical protein